MSLLLSIGLLVPAFALTAHNTSDATAASMTTQSNATIAADDLVTLERRLGVNAGRPCPSELGAPADRVFPDGTRQGFVVPAGKVLVITDLEGEITKKPGGAWPVGGIGYLIANITGAVENQTLRARTQITADTDIASMALHLQSGVVADSGAVVCLRASVVTSTLVGAANVGNAVQVHGYLIAQ